MKSIPGYFLIIMGICIFIFLCTCKKKDLQLPSITTIAVSQITYTSAISGGNINNDGGSPVLGRGLVWDIKQQPTLESNSGFSSDGTGLGIFTSIISGLLDNTNYYVRSYATNSVGTKYGNQVSFTTIAKSFATLITDIVTEVTSTTATCGGNISSDGGASITARGVCWSTHTNPTTVNAKTIDGSGTGTFKSTITGLAQGTSYYIRAYAVNIVGTAYGSQVNLKTIALPPGKPGGMKIIPGNYSITISWDTISSKHNKSVRIYRDTITNPASFYKEINYTNQYTDLMVVLNKKYYYKIMVVDINNLESEKSDEVSAIPKEPINSSTPINGEIGGIHYAFWNFSTPTFTKLVHNFTIFNEPVNMDNSLNKDGLYYQFYQGIINDTIGFYYGIQTSVWKPDGDNKKGVIFSRWKTRDTSNYKTAVGGWGQSAGYEGDFIGIRKNYNWGVGTYKIELKKDSSDSKGDWYGLWINKIPDGIIDYIGSIRFERSSKSSGIKDGGITWTELYYKANPNTPLPRWQVSVNEILADDKKPIHVTSAYSSDKFVGFSNIFTTNGQDVQFLMGPTVLRFHSAGLLW